MEPTTPAACAEVRMVRMFAGVAAVLLGACRAKAPIADSAADVADRPGVEAQAPTGPTLTSVDWAIAWDDTGLIPLEGGGWRVERSDGVALELYTGWIVVDLLVLELCDAAGRRGPPPHGLPDHPSRTAESVVLALHDLEPAALGGARFDPASFCEAGVLFFRAEPTDVGGPADGAMDDRTFWMQGALRPGPDAEWSAVELASNLSVERDLPLQGSTTGNATVTIVLRPGRLLEGLSLDAVPERLALDVVANLGDSAQAVVADSN